MQREGGEKQKKKGKKAIKKVQMICVWRREKTKEIDREKERERRTREKDERERGRDRETQRETEEKREIDAEQRLVSDRHRITKQQ